MVDLTTLGIIIGIISQGISALGLVLQKRAHANIQKRLASGKPKKKWYADPGWLIAFCIFFGGNLLNLLALTFAPQSIISALVVLVLVFNAIYAPILLDNEKVQKIDIIGVIVIITGIVLVVVFGARVELDYTVSELLHLWINTAFVIYWAILFVIVVTLIIYIHIVEKKTTTPEIQKMIKDIRDKDKADKRAEKAQMKSMTRDERRKFLKEKVEDEEDEAAYNREMGIEKENPGANIPETGPSAPGSPYNLHTRLGKFTAFIYAVLPAILSSFNALFSKVLGEVVLKTAKGDNQFTHWATYLFIVLFAIVDGIQIVYLQRALRSYSALYIIPLYQVSLTIFGVATGGLYFKEFNAFGQKPSYYPALFVIGLMIAVSGVGILSKRNPTGGTEKDKKEGEGDTKDDKEAQPKLPEEPQAPEGISPDPEDAPPTTIGTLFVYAVLTGVKWYVKGGDETKPPTELPEEGKVTIAEDQGGSSHPSASTLHTPEKVYSNRAPERSPSLRAPERVPSGSGSLRTPEIVPSGSGSASTSRLTSVNSATVQLEDPKGDSVHLEDSYGEESPPGPSSIYRRSTSKSYV